jgi:hypothetical protein
MSVVVDWLPAALEDAARMRACGPVVPDPVRGHSGADSGGEGDDMGGADAATTTVAAEGRCSLVSLLKLLGHARCTED